MTKKHKEEQFEATIEAHLLANSYQQGDSKDYDVKLGLEPYRVLQFVQTTQAKTWQALLAIHGEKTPAVLLDSLVKELSVKGMLKVLRTGFKCYGKKFRMAYFAPSNLKNDQAWRNYHQNSLSVTRQLYFSEHNNKSLDLVLFLNGLPIVTAELKNPMTGQTVEHAKKQYRQDRDPKELIFEFKKRVLVHFAVDPDLVFMTTRLSGNKTFFLPFNLGNEFGAGNPPASDGGYRAAYLWKEVWARDSLLDILGRFMHLQTEEKRFQDNKGALKRFTKETMIFPRYHQLDVVRKLISHSQQNGPGHNYLVEHSAGSGKSNSIAWLAHRLSSLHNAEDNKIFDSVIVVTDRRVLDQQLQNTIYQFEHKAGVVEKIDEDTRQLVKALTSDTPIIITTLQKFPFIAETLEKLNRDAADYDGVKFSTAGKQFAVIVDEAHSSQSGETAAELKGVLNRQKIQHKASQYISENSLEDEGDYIAEAVENAFKRGKQENLSFFAFTATPKYKTKHIFDEPGEDGKSPFHKYSMRQAIEEGFILDVLKNYTTYKTYFNLNADIKHDQEVERKKAARNIARSVSLHAHNLRQRTEVMVEHFRRSTKHKLGGRAKAMVVTESRLHAVRYKKMFDEYIKEQAYTDIRTLVAFSGSLEDPDIPDTSYTEVSLNDGIKESELPEQFASEHYQVLLVAEKYQTGFDQPLLHTMYVDKKLSGVQAVQTLSRLNRMATGKEDTFVLDFRNTKEEIFKAFKPYYEATEAEELTESGELYRLEHQIEETKLFYPEEVEEFCRVFFKGVQDSSKSDHELMNGVVDKAVDRFTALGDEEQDEVKTLLVNFKNMYGFMSQVLDFVDSDLEQFYTYLKYLLTKLPRRPSGQGYEIDSDINLTYYRLQKIGEGSIDLSDGDNKALKGGGDVGTGRKDEEILLTELIGILNEKFGTDFTPADQLFFDQIHQEAIQDEKLKHAAQVNPIEDFRSVFKKSFEGLVIDRMEGNEEIFAKLMGDINFSEIASEYLMHKVYTQLKQDE